MYLNPNTPTVTTVAATTRSTHFTSSLWKTTVAAGVAAAAVTASVAAAVHAAGVSFDVNGKTIPPAGFAELTFFSTVIGGVLLAVLNRRGGSARRRFLRTTLTLTVLSCVPSVTLADDAASKITLVALHVLVAAIVIPSLVRHANN